MDSITTTLNHSISHVQTYHQQLNNEFIHLISHNHLLRKG